MRARRDQMRLQDGMHLVLDPRAMPNDLVAARHQTTQALGVGVGQPNLRQEVRRPQRRQHAGVDLVGLDVRMGDRLHLQRVGHDHSRDIRARAPAPPPSRCRSPRRRPRLPCSSVRPKPSSPERVMSIRPAGRSWPASQNTTSAKVRWMSMPITRCISCSSQFGSTGAVGNTTTTDPRSRRNRVGRRGGQLLTRALGSSYGSACPLTCSRCPSSRMVAPYARTKAVPAGRAGTAILIPVTNAIESTFATVRHRTVRSKGCLSNKTALAMIFKLAQAAEKSWHRLRGHHQLPKVILGVKFNDGIEIVRSQAQAAAA